MAKSAKFEQHNIRLPDIAPFHFTYLYVLQSISYIYKENDLDFKNDTMCTQVSVNIYEYTP